MVLKLYTASQSTCGRRVAVILHEKKVPYKLIEGNWAAKEHKSDAWTKNQPFGQMPYIDDDGFILFESRAIARYIATKYASSGTALLASDTSDVYAMALLDQAISVETSDFEPSAVGLATEKFFNKMKALDPEPAFVTKHETTLDAKMDGFEKILGKQKYMAGDTLTFVDFYYLPHGLLLVQMGYDYLTNETKYPNTARWWKEISTRDSWIAVKDGIPSSFNG